MATATRVSNGDYVDYTPGTATAAGAVIVLAGAIAGTFIGIAERDIAANVQGALAIRGAFRLPKLSTDACLIGETFYWDAANQRCTTTASTHKKIGRAMENRISGDTTVLISINDLYA